MDAKFLGGMVAGAIAAVIGIGLVLIGIIGIFFFAIIGSVIGAITGLILQAVPILGGMVAKGFAQIGIENANLAEIGAMLGFVAGFFRSAIEHKKCD